MPLLFPGNSSLLGIWAGYTQNNGGHLSLADDWDNYLEVPKLVAPETSCCYGALLTPVTSSHQCCHLLGELCHPPFPSAPSIDGFQLSPLQLAPSRLIPSIATCCIVFFSSIVSPLVCNCLLTSPARNWCRSCFLAMASMLDVAQSSSFLRSWIKVAALHWDTVSAGEICLELQQASFFWAPFLCNSIVSFLFLNQLQPCCQGISFQLGRKLKCFCSVAPLNYILVADIELLEPLQCTPNFGTLINKQLAIVHNHPMLPMWSIIVCKSVENLKLTSQQTWEFIP